MQDAKPKLPATPDPGRLSRIQPDLVTLSAGVRLVRIYRRAGRYPTLWNEFRYFGPAGARFDHHVTGPKGLPIEQARGIIYFALDGLTALAEVFQEARLVDRKNGQPWLAIAEVVNDLSLLNLTDVFCVRAGGSMKLVSGPKAHARNWSRGFYECYRDIHGLYYLSSLTNRPAVALYERAVAVNPFAMQPIYHRALDDALLIEPLRNACHEIGYDFL